MTDDVTAPGPAAQPRPVSTTQLAWLEREVAAWRAAGLLEEGQAQAIRARYVAVRRLTLTRLLLLVGGAFVAVGLLWLVATNLDELSPLLRFLALTALWLGLVAAAEVVADRRAGRGADPETADPLVGALRLLAAGAFGAVVFQAAQSLQVPAYEPGLLGVWGAGALLYAYAVGGLSALLVAIPVTVTWYVWEVSEAAEDGMGFVLPVLLAAVVLSAVALLHPSRLPAFKAAWRETGALLTLLGLFVAAFPFVDLDRFTWSTPVLAGIAVALLAVAAAAWRGRGRARLQALVPLFAAVVGVLLVLWEPPEPVAGVVTAEGYLHAFVSVAVYVVAAGWYAALGVLDDSTRLTFLATAALVLFTTVQSFAVFAPIITGAALFLALGAVLLGSGYLVDRGRRRLVANLEGTS